MWKRLKNIFITEIPKIESSDLDNKTLSLISDLEELVFKNGLVELLEDDVVRIYVLDLYYSKPSDLLIYDDGNFIVEKKFVKCGSFFSDYEHNIYYFLKQLIYKLKGKKLGIKQQEDIKTIISMFHFYLEDEI